MKDCDKLVGVDVTFVLGLFFCREFAFIRPFSKLVDFKNNMLNNEIVIFKSALNSKEYQGLTDSLGKFSFRLPVGDKYEIYILGFKDSTLNDNVLNIPPTTGNAYYKNPFTVDIQHLPAKSFILEDCNFETGKADLMEDSYKVIDELVAYLKP